MTESSFGGAGRGAVEKFYAMSSEPGRDFAGEAEQLLAAYDAAADPAGLVFLRFHLSDIGNQAAVLREMLGERYGFVSLVGQAPVTGGRLALEAYHIEPVKNRKCYADARMTTVDVELEHYRLLYSGMNHQHIAGSEPQTMAEFAAISEEIARRGGTAADNLARTWIYCRDIDNNYAGLVKARREWFAEHGMTAATHYVASTGINGDAEEPSRLVRVDAFSLFGHVPGQIEYMSAPEHMSNTTIYGVTFERGTRIVYGDRSAYYISGTASIDREGQIVHPGDVGRQTERMLENVQALLANHGGSLKDLKQAVVYLRDGLDRDIVLSRLESCLPPDLPFIAVRAPVCRPGWLVELDGIAVNSSGNPKFKDFA
jgi:enamine deaminase RidA (YjgF/YER057c/UK114 family)